jgi:hypothetical protein
VTATPILDLQQEPPQPGARHRQSGLLLFLIGLLVAVIFSPPLLFIGNGQLPPFDLLLFLPMTYLCIGLHEVGHLMCGVLVGMRPGGIMIGGFWLFKSGRNWVFRFHPRYILAGGLARSLPKKGEFRITPFAFTAAGGPFSNLLCAAGAAIWIHKFGGSPFVGTFFFMSGLLGVFSLWPIASGVNRSDGARLLLFLRRPSEAGAWIALVQILADEANGALPKDWDSELWALAFPPAAQSPEYPYVHLLALYRSLNLGSEEEGLRFFETCLATSAKSGTQLRHNFYLQAAGISAWIRKDVPQARTWLDRARKLRKSESVDSIEAGIAVCEQRYDDALRLIAASRARLDRRKLDSGIARFARIELDEAERKCRELMAPREPAPSAERAGAAP